MAIRSTRIHLKIKSNHERGHRGTTRIPIAHHITGPHLLAAIFQYRISTRPTFIHKTALQNRPGRFVHKISSQAIKIPLLDTHQFGTERLTNSNPHHHYLDPEQGFVSELNDFNGGGTLVYLHQSIPTKLSAYKPPQKNLHTTRKYQTKKTGK